EPRGRRLWPGWAEHLPPWPPAGPRRGGGGGGPRELGEVVREHVDAARDAARATRPGSARGDGGFGRWVAGRLGKAFSLALALAVIYILIRALGDAQTNRMMDKVIATTIEQLRQLF
ncbi:MAG: hypothetical protein KDE68_00580, partial [Rhodocyclaceae bacterium]|nr:hypothetical protein [Rhodocyclaceae bacterium]